MPYDKRKDGRVPTAQRARPMQTPDEHQLHCNNIPSGRVKQGNFNSSPILAAPTHLRGRLSKEETEQPLRVPPRPRGGVDETLYNRTPRRLPRHLQGGLPRD